MVNEVVVRKARDTRRCRSALQSLGAELPADDAGLDQLLDYRLLLKLHPDRLEVLDLIHRRDLERHIKQIS